MTTVNADDVVRRDADRRFAISMRDKAAENLAAKKVAMAAQLDVLSTCADKTVIMFEYVYAGQTYTYAGIKVNGYWYLTGSVTQKMDHTDMVVWLLTGTPVTKIDVMVRTASWTIKA